MKTICVGGMKGLGGLFPRGAIGGESFIRHIDDKLIYNFKSGSGTTVKDRSREGNDGTLADKDGGANYPTWIRNGLSFDGTNNYVLLPNVSSLQVKQNLTLDAVFINTATSHNSVLGRYYAQDGLIAGITLRSILKIGGESYHQDTSRGLGKVELSLTYDEAKINHYVDAVFKKCDNITGDCDHCTYVWNIGRYGFDGWYFDGIVLFVRIINKALSQIEIQQNYLANKFAGNN